ncbi:MAG: ABC transporter substrate-binding protein [Clostridia bacterium]|nr:ABC transporter substrate-binding protein [Clostridia bacterium]
MKETKKFRRILCAVLAVVSIISLTACGPKSSETSNGEVPELVWYNRSATTRDHQMVYDEVNKYIEPKIGATVKNISIIGAEYNEKIRLIMASGEKFDILYTGGSGYTNYVKNGSLAPMDDLLEEYGKEIKEITPEYALNAAKLNGVLYGLPFFKDYAVEHTVYYNKDMADKYNLDMDSVKEFKDLAPIYEVIRDNEPTTYPLNFPLSLTPFELLQYDDIAGAEGFASIELEGDPNTIVNPYATEQAKEYYKVMHDFYKKGFIRRDIATENTGAGGGTFSSIEQELPYLVDQKNQTSKYQYGVVHLIKPKMGTYNVTTCMMAIPSTSEHPEKAMQLINLINTDKYLRNLVSLGIEGKHWIAVGENQFKLPEGCEKKADTGFETYVSPQGNKYLMRMIEGTPEDIYDKYLEFDENAIKSPALGFVYNADGMMNELSAFNNVYQEYMNAIISGAVDPEEMLPKALEKFESAGMSRFIADVQKQYDEWRENK